MKGKRGMKFSEELQSRIKNLFKNNEELRDKLLLGDADSIRQIGALSQKKINPEDIIKAYESNNNQMEELYKKARFAVELKVLYRDLCLEFSRIARNANDMVK